MKLEKRNTFSNDIILIDGLWGTGKSLLGPIISGMTGVEKVKAESHYEYISWLFYFGKITEDAALWLLRTYADSSQYHNSISREVNLRWGDDTGLKNAPDKWKYIKRLFGGEGDFKVEEINGDNLAFCAMSHMLMLAPDLLKLAYGDRVKIIEMVRHPLYMVNHFAAYLKRFESSREFTMSYYHEGIKIPWFIKGMELEFVHSNPTEKAVICITKLYPWLSEKIDDARSNGLAVLDLSFEEAVFETSTTLNRLEKFTGRQHHSRISAILKGQKLPRITIAKGRGHSNYGWIYSNESDSSAYTSMMLEVNKNCSSELVDRFQNIINWYNNKYPSKLSIFQD